MAVEHNVITDGNGTTTSERHEPKGASIASAGQVYISDGAASGSWDYTDFVLTVRIDDISTAASYWVVSPYTADIEKVYTVIDGTIATADASITEEIAGVAVTDGTVTVAYSGSAAGDVDSATPSAANAVTAGQAIEIITDGASTNSVACDVTLLMKRTG